MNNPCVPGLVKTEKDASVPFPKRSWSLDNVAHEKQHTAILHQNLVSGWPDESPALSGRRGGNLRADCIEDLVGRFLDVLKTCRQEFRVAIVELNVILRR